MMLDGIRNNAQSWGVKIAFGIIILVFVFWGVGSYTGPKGLVATVNGKNITEVEFQRAYAQMEDNIRRSAPNLTPEMMEGLQLERRVLDQLIQEKLIESEAERAGLTVSPYELRALIQRRYNKYGVFPVMIRADGNAEHRRVRAAMDVVTECGIPRIGFVAIKEKKAK